MRQTLRTVALLLLAGGVLAGQSASPPAQGQGQPPVTFKVEVNYVEIDAVVTDAQGKFVTDLTKDDFQITEGGAAQAITAFSRVEVPIERADPPLFRRAVVEPDVRSNRDAFNGRVLLIVMDDLQTDFRRTSRVQAAARQFIRRYVGANDMVAIVTTGGGTAAAQEFTVSQARLIAAVDKFMGQKSTRDTLDMERVMKARNTYETLRGVSIEGTVEITEDPDVLWSVGVDVWERYNGPYSDEVKPFVEFMLVKRSVVRVKVDRIRSWDHRKLNMPATELGGTTAEFLPRA